MSFNIAVSNDKIIITVDSFVQTGPSSTCKDPFFHRRCTFTECHSFREMDSWLLKKINLLHSNFLYSALLFFLYKLFYEQQFQSYFQKANYSKNVLYSQRRVAPPPPHSPSTQTLVANFRFLQFIRFVSSSLVICYLHIYIDY